MGVTCTKVGNIIDISDVSDETCKSKESMTDSLIKMEVAEGCRIIHEEHINPDKDEGFVFHEEEARKKTLKSVSNDGNSLENMNDILKNDEIVVLNAIKENFNALRFASEELKGNKDFMLEVISELDKNIDGCVLKYASEGLRDDKDVVLASIRRYGSLEFASTNLKNDRKVVLEAVKKNGLNLRHVNSRFQRDEEIVIFAVEQNGAALEFASEEFRNQRKIVRISLSQDGYFLRYAGIEIKDDEEIALGAVRSSKFAFNHVSERLRNSRRFVLKAVSIQSVLEFCEVRFKDSKEVVMTALRSDQGAMVHATERVKQEIEDVST